MMGTSMEKIREMVDVNTIIGDPITCPDGTVVIPVSKVGFGFAAGGSDWPSKQDKALFGGGSGAGVSIQPLAFLVVSNGDVRILPIESGGETVEHLIASAPGAIQSIIDIFKKDKGEDKKAKKEAEKAAKEAAKEAVKEAEAAES